MRASVLATEWPARHHVACAVSLSGVALRQGGLRRYTRAAAHAAMWLCLCLCLGVALGAAVASSAVAVTPRVAAGGWHIVAPRNDGTLRAAGADGHGQLGLGRSMGSATPLQAASLGQVRAIAGGDNHSVALKRDGTVWTWGDNGIGQLGNGAYSSRLTPTLVANEAADGPLDMIPGVGKNIPADKVPPFFLTASKSGGLGAMSLSVAVKGRSASGTFASAASSRSASHGSFAATAYNVYVAAYAPAPEETGSPLWWQLDPTSNWGPLTWPMAQFISGVALDSQTANVQAQILSSVDLTQLVETVSYSISTSLVP